MSRTPEEWEEAKQQAIQARTHLWESTEQLHNIDNRFNEIDELVHHYMEQADKLARTLNQIIGGLTHAFD